VSGTAGAGCSSIPIYGASAGGSVAGAGSGFCSSGFRPKENTFLMKSNAIRSGRLSQRRGDEPVAVMSRDDAGQDLAWLAFPDRHQRKTFRAA
jgi:hypothetical protein